LQALAPRAGLGRSGAPATATWAARTSSASSRASGGGDLSAFRACGRKLAAAHIDFDTRAKVMVSGCMAENATILLVVTHEDFALRYFVERSYDFPALVG